MQSHLKNLGDDPSFDDAVSALLDFSYSPEARSLHPPAPPEQSAVKNVISIGTHCLTSAVLKRLNLKASSGPFDWIFSSIPMVTHCILDDFNHFLDKKYYVRVPPENRRDAQVNACNHTFYLERFSVPFVFNHRDATISENYLYYARCVARFRSMVQSGNRTLFVAIVPFESHVESDFSDLCCAVRQYDNVEILMVVAKKSNWKKNGFELISEIGRNKIFELDMSGELGPVFTAVRLSAA